MAGERWRHKCRRLFSVFFFPPTSFSSLFFPPTSFFVSDVFHFLQYFFFPPTPFSSLFFSPGCWPGYDDDINDRFTCMYNVHSTSFLSPSYFFSNVFLRRLFLVFFPPQAAGRDDDINGNVFFQSFFFLRRLFSPGCRGTWRHKWPGRQYRTNLFGSNLRSNLPRWNHFPPRRQISTISSHYCP